MEFAIGKPVRTYNGWIPESEKWLGSELNEQGSVPRRHIFFPGVHPVHSSQYQLNSGCQHCGVRVF